MVYYYTSGNVKMLRNIIIDYGATSELSPYEYMKTYVEKCPESINDAKVTWIAKIFLSIQKHGQFLKSIASQLSEELSEEDQDYFLIIFHAVIFEIGSNDMQFLYKCLFNLSKPLLNTFTTFLGNNEVLTYISHMAQSHYDAKFITENIIAPIFTWQPYISQMGHNYAEYAQKLESRKVKPPTVPIQPNVLNRKSKGSSPPPARVPATPPNSLKAKDRKMLTRSAIDQKLKNSYEKNKKKALHLVNNAKSKSYYFKSENYDRKLSSIRDEMENEITRSLPKPRQKFVMKHNPLPVKETAATLKRINKRVQLTAQDEVQWLEDLLKSCTLAGKVEELQEYDRQEREKEMIYNMERKHLEGQISHEQAQIAKKKIIENKRKKYEEFLKEKESWNEEIETWKKIETEKIQKHIQELSLLELNLVQARNGVAIKNKENADELKEELGLMMDKALKEKQDELEKKIKMIKEIKMLALFAKKAKVPKMIDFTETPGFGLLSEMSMAELQERLSIIKMDFKDQLESKRKAINDRNKAAKQELEETKNNIATFMTEQAIIKKRNKKPKIALDSSSVKEISNLKKTLEEKRKLRMQLTT